MKKILAILLSIVVMSSFTACVEEKAEKYCSSCGEGITKLAVYCEHCGAAVSDDKIESEDNLSDNTTSIESKGEETSKPAETSRPTETSRPAQTSKPTETSKSSAPTHTHSYSKYVCTVCGVVEKTNAYEYLKEWVKTNGTPGSDGTIDYIFEGKNNSAKNMGIRYSADLDAINIWHFDATSGRSAFFGIYLDDYYYGFTFADDKIYGYINAGTYTKNTTLSYTDSKCSVLEPSEYLSVAQSSLNLVLSCFRNFLYDNELGITLADLGFKSY